MSFADRWLTNRFWAVVAILAFLPAMISFAVAPGTLWVEYPGILFHLAVFALVYRLEAPEWGRAAGYAWLTLDVLTAVLTLHGVSADIAPFVRLSGHIFGGIWFVAASSRSASKLLRWVGTIGGLWLGGYTLVSVWLPMRAVAPASILILGWLVLVAVRNDRPRGMA